VGEITPRFSQFTKSVVENAFKHGSQIDGFLRIEIKVELDENQLYFNIRNSYIYREENKLNGGIGLENIRKRLELNYSDNYNLKKRLYENWYEVQLLVSEINKTGNG